MGLKAKFDPSAVADYLSDLSEQLAVIARQHGFKQSAAYLELARLALPRPCDDDIEIVDREFG